MDYEEIPAEVKRWIEDLYYFLFPAESEGGDEDDMTLPDDNEEPTKTQREKQKS